MMKRIVFIMVAIVTLFLTEVKAYNKSVIDITKLTMSDSIEYLDKRVITSEELVNLYLDRINSYNDDFKALITINPNIVEEAKYSDQLRNEGNSRGILEGIPIIVKDNIDVKGMPTTAGSKALADNYPNDDAEVVRRLKAEGALIIAKANMSEFAFSAKDSYSSYGYVSNAFKLGYTSYGSSGGSAVGVALNFASAALGTDTNSSVRLPASGAGLVGLRPTTGKIPNDGIINYDINRDTVGIISKSVLDNRILWGVISGEKYELIDQDNQALRIGVPRSFYEGTEKTNLKQNKVTNSFIKEMLDVEISKLVDEQIELVYLDDVYNNYFARLNNISISGYTMCKAFNSYINGTTGTIRSFGQLTKSKGKVSNLNGYNKSCNYSDRNYNKTLGNLALAKQYIENIYNQYNLDFMIYPTTKNEIYAKGNNSELINISGTMASAVGYPSITVPLGYYADMPYGIEIMGRDNKETQLYNMASIIEKHNNLINSHETAAPKLYEVPEEIDNLVNMYIDNKSDDNWTDSVQEYFRNYNNIEDEKKIYLDLVREKELESNSEEKIIKKINNESLVSDMYVYFFIILGSMGIFLYVPKITMRKIKKI